MSAGDADKKQILLRLNQGTYAELVRWAEADFRSVNGQIEYILSRAVAQRRPAAAAAESNPLSRKE
jgi:hypothetical protein